MKISTTLLFFCSFLSFGQQLVSEIVVPTYEPSMPNPGIEIMELPVNFNDFHIKKTSLKPLEGVTIEQIDLVYSTFKESPDFNQVALNEQRMQQLIRIFPEAKNPLIHWRSVGQSNGKTSETAREMYHGFVIYYRPVPTKESIENEIRLIEAYVKNPGSLEKTYDSLFGVRTLTTTWDSIEPEPLKESYAFGFLISADSPHMVTPDSCYLKIAGERIETPAEFNNFRDSINRAGCFNITYVQSTPSSGISGTFNFSYSAMMIDPECTAAFPISSYSSYSGFSFMPTEFNYGIVKETFERNPTWENALVLVDVTGSMSPYLSETMAWLKATQDSSQVSAFVFFNDGDAKHDAMKTVGSVGGIYSTPNTSFETVLETMTSTMMKGGGGDCPENNIEAAILGLKQYPESSEIIMVADNYATPRDLKLLDRITVPLHIIVCGSNGQLNQEYVQAALRTGGSIHTMKEDLDLRGIGSTETFSIGDTNYQFSGGKLRVVVE